MATLTNSRGVDVDGGREGPVLPPAAAADLDVDDDDERSQTDLPFLPATIIMLSYFPGPLGECTQLTRMKVSFCVGRSSNSNAK